MLAALPRLLSAPSTPVSGPTLKSSGLTPSLSLPSSHQMTTRSSMRLKIICGYAHSALTTAGRVRACAATLCNKIMLGIPSAAVSAAASFKPAMITPRLCCLALWIACTSFPITRVNVPASTSQSQSPASQAATYTAPVVQYRVACFRVSWSYTWLLCVSAKPLPIRRPRSQGW
jgi:hypothetical protein